jgi:hypothetical protein
VLAAPGIGSGIPDSDLARGLALDGHDNAGHAGGGSDNLYRHTSRGGKAMVKSLHWLKYRCSRGAVNP